MTGLEAPIGSGDDVGVECGPTDWASAADVGALHKIPLKSR